MDAADVELFICDLNDIATSMTPGTAIMPAEDINTIVLPPKSLIWDLQKNEPTIKLRDIQSRVR